MAKTSKKQAKKIKRRERKALADSIVRRLARSFGPWCHEHMPKGTKWDDAAADGVMGECVGNYLCEIFPDMDKEWLRRLAEANVRIKERRINVDMPGIARGILKLGGAFD